MDSPTFASGFESGSQLDLHGGTVRAEDVQRICADEWRKGKSLPLRLRNGMIEGGLNFDHVQSSAAIKFDGISVGKVRLHRARFDMVSFKNCTVEGIEAAGLTTTGPVDLQETKFVERVRLVAASIGADLNCSHASFARSTSQRENGWSAFVFDNASVEGNVWLVDVKADGNVHAWRVQAGRALLASDARVQGELLFRDANVAQNGDLDRVCADGANLMGARFGASLTFNGASFAKSGVRLAGVNLDGDLTVKTLKVARRPAVDLTRARVAGRLEISEVTAVDDCPIGVKLSGTHVGTLACGPGTWVARPQDWHHLDDIEVTRLADPDADRLESWLRSNAVSSPQPWQEIGAALRRGGHESGARNLAIGRERQRTRKLPRLARPWRWLLDLTVGYGYRPWKALVASSIVVGIWFVLYHCFVHFDTGRGPRSGELLYSVDAFLPIDLRYYSTWTPHETIGSVLGVVEAGLGWVLAALLIAAVGGVLRKD